MRRIAAAGSPGDSEQLVQALHWFGMRRRGPVDKLAHLADHPDPKVRRALVWAVENWSSPAAKELLHRLAQDPDATVREAVEWTPPEPRS